MSKAGISKTFTTRNTLTSNQSILMSPVDGPFKKLIGGWKFIPLSPEACKIEFHLDFEFTNKLIEMALAGSSKSWPLTWCRRSLRAPKRFTVPANIRVEVAYALPEKQYLQRVTPDEGRRSSRRLSPAVCWRCVMTSIWRKTSWVSTVVR